jgi:hypothetical protein
MILLSISILSLGVPGCGYFFGPKGTVRPFEIKDEHLSCLSELTPLLNEWVKSEKPEKIESILDCASVAIQKFSVSTRGENEDGWSKEELDQFLRKYIGKGDGNKPSWLEDGLRYKQSILGGSADRLSRAEFLRLQTLISILKPALNKISPYLSILRFSKSNVSVTEAEAAINSLREIAGTVEGEFKKLGAQGALPDRPPIEINTLANSLNSTSLMQLSVASYLPLVESLKRLVVGGHNGAIAAYEWPMLIHRVADIWIFALRINYKIANRDDFLTNDLPAVEAAIDEGTNLLTQIVRIHGRDGIPIERLQDVISGLANSDLLPKGISAASLNEVLPVILSKILYGNSHQNSFAMNSVLSETQLRQFTSIIRDWLAGQRLLNQAMGDSRTIDMHSLVLGLENIQNSALDAEELKIKPQLIQLLVNGRGLVFDNQSRLILVGGAQQPSYRRSDIERLNLARSIVTMLIRGYAHNSVNADKALGLTEAETQEIYLDARQIGLELGWVDSRSNTAGARTFLEGNLFLSVSNGDELFDLKEIVEWFHIVYSGGRLADRIHDELNPLCGIDGTSDVFGKRKLKSVCFRENFKLRFKRYFANLPGFVNWYSRGGDSLQNKVIWAVERAGRATGLDYAPVDSSDLRSMAPIIQYDESLFLSRDADSNDVLDNGELWSAYSIVRPFIKKIVGPIADGETIQRAIFSWLLYFGEAPKQNWIGGGKIVLWAGARHFVSETADRLNILKVISSFASVARESRVNAIELFWKNRLKDAGGLRLLRYELESGSSATVRELSALFQCQPEAQATFTTALQLNSKSIFENSERASSIEDASAFISGIKTMITADSRLAVSCLPF